jgi:resuscitation-promoting factor RpfB
MLPSAVGLVPLRRNDRRGRSPVDHRPPTGNGLQAVGTQEATRRRRAPLSLRALRQLLVALLVPLVGFTWVSGERTVTLMVDGQPRTVASYADSVGDLLARSGLALGPHDRLVPEAGTPLSDGMVVELVHAREVTLLVGEQQRTALVTALTVDEVLAELGTPLGRRDIVRPSRLARVRPGMVVEVSRPVALLVVHDGAELEVITDAGTVRTVLERLNIEVGPSDRVEPPLDAAPEPGMTIEVRRVLRGEEVRQVRIPFETVERRTAALAKGKQREVRAGREGLKEVRELVTRVDGKVEHRELRGERTLRRPESRIVEIGTGSSPSAPGRSGQSPAAAQVGRAPNSQEGKASWYDHPGADPLTAAHRTLPFGTIVTVTNLDNGKQVRVRINDRGPFIEGRIIDLNRPAFREIASTSQGVLRVRIDW